MLPHVEKWLAAGGSRCTWTLASSSFRKVAEQADDLPVLVGVGTLQALRC
jgi:hypothetical protein